MDEDYRPMGGGIAAPVKVGDEMDVTIEAVGEKGDGLAKKDGFVLFIPNTQEGENVRVKVTRVLRKVGFAEVVGEGSPQEESSEEKPKEAQEAAPAPEEAEDSEDFGEEVPEEESSEEEKQETA